MANWTQIDASPSSAAVEFNSNSDLGSCGSANAVLLTLDRLSIKQATVDISNNNNSNAGSIAFQEVTLPLPLLPLPQPFSPNRQQVSPRQRLRDRLFHVMAHFLSSTTPT